MPAWGRRQHEEVKFRARQSWLGYLPADGLGKRRAGHAENVIQRGGGEVLVVVVGVVGAMVFLRLSGGPAGVACVLTGLALTGGVLVFMGWFHHGQTSQDNVALRYEALFCVWCRGPLPQAPECGACPNCAVRYRRDVTMEIIQITYGPLRSGRYFQYVERATRLWAQAVAVRDAVGDDGGP